MCGAMMLCTRQSSQAFCCACCADCRLVGPLARVCFHLLVEWSRLHALRLSNYAFYVNVERPEVVFVHMRLLTLAKDSANEPVFEIMLVQVHPQSKTNHWDPLVKDRTYEITFSSIERPKLLSKLSTLLLDIGLNIEEAHAWSTTDGYSLILFVVDGWSQEVCLASNESMFCVVGFHL